MYEATISDENVIDLSEMKLNISQTTHCVSRVFSNQSFYYLGSLVNTDENNYEKWMSLHTGGCVLEATQNQQAVPACRLVHSL